MRAVEKILTAEVEYGNNELEDGGDEGAGDEGAGDAALAVRVSSTCYSHV